MERYLVVRPRDTVEVAILRRVENNMFSFVNLTDSHICKCQFTTIGDAVADMDKQIELGNVISYTKI